MKERDAYLPRLLVAASKARPSVPAAAPAMSAALLTKVLAHWREARPEKGGEILLWMYRWALTCAALLMLAAVVWSLTVPDSTAASEPGDLLASTEVQADLLP
jgi:Tfp pilus assembly protein PilN